jgi:murein hydrolase activator
MRSSLVFTIFCIISEAAQIGAQPPSSTPQRTLDSLRRELQSIDRQLEAGNVREKDILREIDVREHRLNIMEGLVRERQRQIAGLSDSTSTLESSIHKREGRLAQIGNQIITLEDDQRRLSGGLVRALIAEHRLGGWNALELLFGASSWEEFMNRRSLLSRLEDAEKKSLQALTGTVSNLQETESGVFSATQELRLHKEQLDSRRQESEEATRALQDDLRELHQTRKSLQTRLKETRQNRQLLADRRREVAAAQAQIEEMISKIVPRALPLPGIALGNLKGQLPWPIVGRIVQGFGLQRNRDLATITENPGIDIGSAVPSGVISVADGEVSSITWLRGFGNVCIVEHPGSFYTVYARLGQVTVQPHAKLKAGTTIGYPSYDPAAEGYRVHFELWSGKEKKNPQEWLRPQ